jgi:hypothetical protein
VRASGRRQLRAPRSTPHRAQNARRGPRPDGRKNGPPARCLTMAASARVARRPDWNDVWVRVLRTPAAKRCLRRSRDASTPARTKRAQGTPALRSVFRTDATAWPHRAADLTPPRRRRTRVSGRRTLRGVGRRGTRRAELESLIPNPVSRIRYTRTSNRASPSGDTGCDSRCGMRDWRVRDQGIRDQGFPPVCETLRGMFRV